MLNWGIIGACIATFFGGLSAALQKKESMQYNDRSLALLYLYMFVAAWALVFLGIYMVQTGESFLPDLVRWQWLLLVGISVFGYIGGVFYFKAYKHLHGAVVSIVGSVSVFFLYFTNKALFPAIETLSNMKIAIAILFLLIIVQFIIKKSEGNKEEKPEIKNTRKYFINPNILYVLGGAGCSTIFNTTINYTMKAATMSPFHLLFFSEALTLVIAITWYFTGNKGTVKSLMSTMTKRDGLTFGTIGLCGSIAGALYYYATIANPGNLISFIKLFTIVTGATFCWIFLNDRITKRQIGLILCAIALLIAFVLVK